MTDFFPHEWAESANSLAFVNAVAAGVPVLRGLINHAPPYTPYWGMFYATFWCLAPLFLVAGAMYTFFYADEYYERIKVNKPQGYILGVLFFLMLSMIPFFLPFIGGFPKPFLNQMSDFLPLRLLAWWTTAMSTFALGWAIGCCYQRLVAHKKTEEVHGE
ncbi:hypothetical protein HX870_03620 [Pseudomonas gingeri]|uniref:Transmembrane protein n=1 Tax=Pseudomonas gingeri TaxID=117681 RepID=A0A7Y8C1T0_9PSED|nr:hypothetical protein [Pseudomonas gingeri]NWB95567.1 hypothetical protein [Pseudomonas gingeri]NWD66708.1 hypothetical protein [Pseudomonas gingeri]